MAKRLVIEGGIVVDIMEIGVVVVVITAEQLVGTGAADRDAVAVLGDALHQLPLHVIGDGIDRRVVLAHQDAQLVEKPVGLEVYGGVAQLERGDGVLDHLALLVALVGVHDGEAVHVIVENILRNTNQRIGIDPATHAESQRHVGPES